MEGSKTSMSERENRNFIFDKFELSGPKATFPSVNVKYFFTANCNLMIHQSVIPTCI